METDVLIIGCGPAGLQAAIHASRKRCSVTVVGKSRASSISGCHMDNYMGIRDICLTSFLVRYGIKGLTNMVVLWKIDLGLLKK